MIIEEEKVNNRRSYSSYNIVQKGDSEMPVVEDPLLAPPGSKVLYLGNEAVARGAIEAGAKVATSYPGTPASEILSSLARVAKKVGMYVEWAVNEKVAFEVAFAASLANVRAIMSCKHLGVNWISDALLVAAYTGVNGGLVIVSADDTHPYSSQNAEDTRYYTKLAKIPCLEPSDIPEAKEIVKYGFKLSETLQLPVYVRITQRISHSKSDVTVGEVEKVNREARFEKDFKRYVMIATYSKERQRVLNKKYYEDAVKIFDNIEFNKVISNESSIGVIGCGVTFGYVVEALERLGLADKVDVMKLSTPSPLPYNFIGKFLENKEKVLVVEEGEPIVEEGICRIALSFNRNVSIYGQYTGHIPREFELSTGIVAKAIKAFIEGVTPSFERKAAEEIGKRIPALCAGCPHRASYYALKRALRELGKKGIIVGDRGCYNQGIHPPLRAIDTCICMGASIAMAVGFERAGVKEPVIAVIGDSTFYHAGVQPLLDAVFNNSKITVLIFDNSWTSMTGHQPNPGTGVNAMGEPSLRIRAENIARSCGVGFVKVVNPLDLNNTIKTIKEAIMYDGVAVVVCRSPCTLQYLRELRKRGEKPDKIVLIEDRCVGCKLCVTQLGCPALLFDEEKKKPIVNRELCSGCGLCSQVCPREALVLESKLKEEE